MTSSLKLDLHDVTVRLEPEHGVASLACVNFIKSRLLVETYSDLSQDVDLVSQVRNLHIKLGLLLVTCRTVDKIESLTSCCKGVTKINNARYLKFKELSRYRMGFQIETDVETFRPHIVFSKRDVTFVVGTYLPLTISFYTKMHVVIEVRQRDTRV